MNKPKKLPSGAWNVLVYSHTENGKRKYKSITRSTKAECEYAAADFRRKKDAVNKEPSGLTVREAIERYIALSEVLSPTTLDGYNKILKTSFKDIMDVKVSKLTDTKMQEAVNTESKRISGQTGQTISAKTVKNEWGLLSSALRSVSCRTFNIKLPKVQHKNEILPEPSEVIALVKGKDIEVPCLLAMWCGLRLSEVRGLKYSDLHEGYLYVNRVVVDVNGSPVEKDLAKTDSSIRRVSLPPYLADLIGSGEGYVVTASGNSIYKKFKRLQEGTGINISFHDLRHLYASISLNVIGIAPKLVQLEGGWSSPSVMNKVYSQGISSAQVQAAQLRNEYFESLIKMQDAMQDEGQQTLSVDRK